MRPNAKRRTAIVKTDIRSQALTKTMLYSTHAAFRELLAGQRSTLSIALIVSLRAHPGLRVDAHGIGEHRAQPNHLIRRANMGTEKKRAQARPKQSQAHLDDLLDEALEETFPASDAVSIYRENHKDTAAAEPEAQETT
jgi:hypothetical protein